jgi:putative SOS response-associated peptidase YedK
MCGRYSLTSPPEAVRRLFGLDLTPNWPARYNSAPTQLAPVVRLAEGGGKRELVMLRWGLVPFWAKDLAIGARLINARADGVAEKPAFRSAFRRRRCLVPADGFYEWQGIAKAKQPMRIVVGDGEPFAFAGLWERWDKGPDGAVESFTIITTDAAASIAPIHARMPVMLAPEDHGAWLEQAAQLEALRGLLRPFPADRLRAYAVSTRVNFVRNDDAACIAPLATQAGLL